MLHCLGELLKGEERVEDINELDEATGSAGSWSEEEESTNVTSGYNR